MEARQHSGRYGRNGDDMTIGQVLLWVRPDGWQARARRNAWAAMVADSQRRQERLIAARDSQQQIKAGLQAQVP
jgi:hypothetical protein